LNKYLLKGDDMMSYEEWFEQHAQKHKKIVDKLVAKGYSEDEIIECFEFFSSIMSLKSKTAMQ
jgi:hypothetical protein